MTMGGIVTDLTEMDQYLRVRGCFLVPRIKCGPWWAAGSIQRERRHSFWLITLKNNVTRRPLPQLT